MNYSIDWLCHCYQRDTGHSIGETITRKKMNNAVREIQDRKYSILEISIKYGYKTQEGFTRAFKKYFGITPGKYKIPSANEEKIGKEAVMYDHIMFQEIKCCTIAEKEKLLKSIDIILYHCQKVRNYGIFSLEEELPGIKNVFFKKGLQMMVDGTEPELLKQILWNYLQCGNYEPHELLERIIFLEGISAIQEGLDENQIIEYLISFLGEDFLETAEEYYGFGEEKLILKQNNYLLKIEEKSRNDTGFEKTINKMNERSLQRLLREIDTRTLAEAFSNLTNSTAEKIFKNISVRVASCVITELENRESISKNMEEVAQDYILKVMQKLTENKDISI